MKGHCVHTGYSCMSDDHCRWCRIDYKLYCAMLLPMMIVSYPYMWLMNKLGKFDNDEEN